MNNGAEHQRGGLSRFCTETTEWNALICSIAFFLIFSAFGTVQNYATSSHGDDGAISLAILYIVLTFSNIIVPLLASYISPRWAMFLGSATYAIYVGANIHEVRYILFAAGALEGFGAALLWVAQGSFITKCSHEYESKHELQINSQLGYYNGLFWAWMVLNQFVGNSLAAALFYFDIPTTTVYIVFTTINIFGVCVFLLIKPFDSQSQHIESQSYRNDSIQSPASTSALTSKSHEGDYHKGQVQSSIIDENDMSAYKYNQSQKNKSNKPTLSEIETIPFIDNKVIDLHQDNVSTVNIFSMISLWCKKEQLLLIPFTLYSGLSQAFQYGNFPAQINDNFHKFGALAVFGFVDAVFSLLFGRISDKIGRLPVLTIAFFAHGAVYVYFYLYWRVEGDHQPSDSDKIQHDWFDFFVVAAFLGVGDAGFNTQLYALYGSLLGEKSEVFANLKFWQSLSMTWGFLSSGIHEEWNIVLISCFSSLVAAALPLYLSAEVRKISRPQTHSLSFS